MIRRDTDPSHDLRLCTLAVATDTIGQTVVRMTLLRRIHEQMDTIGSKGLGETGVIMVTMCEVEIQLIHRNLQLRQCLFQLLIAARVLEARVDHQAAAVMDSR